jgi:diacylglycerol kinase (ATP)
MSKTFSIKDRLKSFGYAAAGLKYMLLTQHNFLIHITLTLIAILLGFLLKITNLEWVAIIIVIGLVMSAEIFNTAIEEIVNIISPHKNEKAGIIKDIAAGAVLVLSIVALTTGIIIFLPKIIQIL